MTLETVFSSLESNHTLKNPESAEIVSDMSPFAERLLSKLERQILRCADDRSDSNPSCLVSSCESTAFRPLPVTADEISSRSFLHSLSMYFLPSENLPDLA